MNKTFINSKYLYSISVILFSFFFNYYYANLGVFPIDTFAFFDTGYNILIDRHPFKDIWITTGPLVDYLQAAFFKVLGISWFSYIAHASVLNSLISFFFFKTLVSFNLSKTLSFFYALSLGALCYTVSGTPFAYIHSYVFSLLSILIFFSAIKFKSKISFFFLPFSMSLAFLSMQNPSTFINFFILIFLLIFFFRKNNRNFIYIFILGSFLMLIILIVFLLITKIPLQNFIQQYILFPLTLGENRILGNEIAHISLLERFTFRNIIGHFKFLNFIIIFLSILTLKDFLKTKLSFENLIINTSLILFGVSFIFNQLLTSNQTFIFSFIPFTAAFIHIYLNETNSLNKFKFLIFILMLFSTLKYHSEYNVKRKFMDLQNVNLNNAIDAKAIDNKLKGLKWITPKYANGAQTEVSLLKETIFNLKNDKRNKLVMSDYQFFSLILEENLNIPNRWYTHDNNSYPLNNHRYFKIYKDHITKAILKNDIKVVYTIGEPNFKKFEIFLGENCNNVISLNKLTTIYELKQCS